MSPIAKCFVTVAALATIDLATFGAWIAILTSIGSLTLAVAAYHGGRHAQRRKDPYRLLAEEQAREIGRLESQLAERDDPT